jgi:CHU_C Type IX secretion signal domain
LIKQEALNYKVILFCLLAGFLNPLKTQTIFPPNLVCATRQTNGDLELTWQLPNNNCGPFIKYEIYQSNNKNGPYALIATITNQSVIQYLHIGADCNNQSNFYYMVSDYNCPGFIKKSSDTLDCSDPIAPMIQYVSVVNNNVDIFWEPSPSPQTYAYIIYRNIGGFNPIDTVFGRMNTSYTDVTANPDQRPERYTIAAMDSCGNTGPFSNLPHETLFMQPDKITCVKEILLAWTKYINWPNDSIKEHRVYFSRNGSGSQIDTVLPSNVFESIFSKYKDGDYLCVFIAAVDPSGNFISRSNEICVTINIVEPANFLYITNATFTIDNKIEIEWMPDTQADIKEFNLLRDRTNSSYSFFAKIPAINPVPSIMTLIDSTPKSMQSSMYYKVQSTDSCGGQILTGYARTIYLSGRPRPNFSNVLKWNAFEIEYGTVDEYDVYRLDNTNVWQLIQTLQPVSGQIQYLDNISDQFDQNGQFCYRIEARGNLNFPNGNTKSFTSISNVDCIKQIPIIYAPTAMVPEGKNNFFKPVISFYKEDTYRMSIYNQWGQKIFDTTDINEAWYGRYNGQTVQQGVYTYLITVTGVNGNVINRTGTVMVIR